MLHFRQHPAVPPRMGGSGERRLYGATITYTSSDPTIVADWHGATVALATHVTTVAIPIGVAGKCRAWITIESDTIEAIRIPKAGLVPASGTLDIDTLAESSDALVATDPADGDKLHLWLEYLE